MSCLVHACIWLCHDDLVMFYGVFGCMVPVNVDLQQPCEQRKMEYEQRKGR